jgi:hypothetical protein
MKRATGRSDQKMAASNAPMLPVLAFVVFGVNLVGSIYASLYGRGLYGDAAALLVILYERSWPLISLSSSRATVELLRQWPVVLLSRYTSASLFECGELLTFVMLSLPTLFCAACWPIAPRTQKAWILFPITFLLTGFAATSMNAIGEAAIASSYYWILLFVLQFRTRSIAGQCLFLLICLPAYRLHEGAFLLTIALLFALALRIQRSPDCSREKIFVRFAFVLLMTILAYQIVSIIFPAYPDDRAHIIQALMHFEFLYYDHHFNLPLFTGTVAIMSLGGVLYARATLPPREANRTMKLIVVVWAIVALVAISVAITVEESFSPFAQNQARYHPSITSAFLAVAIILLRRFQLREQLWVNRATIFILFSLCATQAVADAAATRRWNTYVADLQSRLIEWQGLVPWEETLQTGDERADTNWRLFNIGWVVPFPCIIFAPNGTVNAIIDLPKGTSFRPLDPERPDLLPKLRGINFAPYKRYLADQIANRP